MEHMSLGKCDAQNNNDKNRERFAHLKFLISHFDPDVLRSNFEWKKLCKPNEAHLISDFIRTASNIILFVGFRMGKRHVFKQCIMLAIREIISEYFEMFF